MDEAARWSSDAIWIEPLPTEHLQEVSSGFINQESANRKPYKFSCIPYDKIDTRWLQDQYWLPFHNSTLTIAPLATPIPAAKTYDAVVLSKRKPKREIHLKCRKWSTARKTSMLLNYYDVAMILR